MTETVTIMQGRWPDCSGRPLAEVLAEDLERAARFLQDFPTTAKFYQPAWLIEFWPNEIAHSLPKGYERYQILPDGTLGPRETNWDSGD